MTAILHLAIPGGDLATTVKFYTDVLGCTLGNSEDGRWVDVNFWGNELTLHQSQEQLPTVRHDVEMGAVLGRVPPEGRAHLRAYARDIGLAFQIADDLLDVEGDEAKAGKALRKDEEQGKQTFVTLMGVEQARAQATMLVEQAGRHLSSYGEDARLLIELADFVVKRDH